MGGSAAFTVGPRGTRSFLRPLEQAAPAGRTRAGAAVERFRIGVGLSGALAPGAEQDREVGSVDDAVVVEV
ncbi:MAG: hypothetical protein ACO38P_13610, partial [Phycisphaerales bacterium]